MRDYLNRLRQQFQRFMIGRYGMDQFGRFLSGVLLALIIFNLLIPAALPSRILWALEWIVLVILYARMFSKNIRNPLIFLQKMASYSCFGGSQVQKSYCKQACVGFLTF